MLLGRDVGLRKKVSGLLLGFLAWPFVFSGTSEAQQNPSSFPAGLAPFLERAGSDNIRRPSHGTDGIARGTMEGRRFSQYVYGPSGSLWRISPSLSGAWLTDSKGNSYRATEGLSGVWVTGPGGEIWKITPRLGGGAWITGPQGKIYSYQPSLGGGGRITGPYGERYSVYRSLSGSWRVEKHP
jgi:hypothetical protein